MLSKRLLMKRYQVRMGGACLGSAPLTAALRGRSAIVGTLVMRGAPPFFQVTIIAVTPCRYILWQRQNLEYLLVKENFLAAVFALLLERDITSKLYAMNDKIVTEKGEHLDIRLPSVTGSMTYQVAPDNDNKDGKSITACMAR